MLFSSIIKTVFGIGMAKMLTTMNAKVGRKITAIAKSINEATTGVPTTISTDVVTLTRFEGKI